ncbi:hypothetical protein CY0110_29604 [Crocosphaera chwakensis CCY0110]|uniref:Uncharacterized protein n=1 Tax=Crocosphaera chwakensis CCY0110 TaxID=391612 RepID=A3INL6_9CHRO|nr:hypothetical protein CY0110_29604 [Crocosphaera chwakensis CCY0110]
METVSTTEVTQTLPSVISKVQKEPVIIRGAATFRLII